MSNQPLISICIPSYNGSASIVDTINSVLRQSLQNFEIIVNDDCSTDNTCELVQSIGDSRIRLYRNSQNLGAVGNCNKALEYASGKYMKILMQDDILEKEHLKKSTEIMESNSAVRMTTCQSHIINENNEIISSRKRYKKDRIFDGTAYAKKSLRGRNIFGEPSLVCFRREVYDSGLRFDSSFKFNFDWDFAIGAVSGGKIAYIAEPLASFRISTTSISGNYYLKNKKLIYNEATALFKKHYRSLGMPQWKILIIKLNTIVLLALKALYVAIVLHRK